MNRETALKLLVPRLTNEVIVTNLGFINQDMQHFGDRPLNYYMFGSMGQCSSIGLGVALARPDLRIICLDGDGALLMNLGVLCTAANAAPPNLAIIAIDN